MKTHSKKKAYRRWLQQERKQGKANLATGQMVNREQLVSNSMKRDYTPQQ